MALLEFNLKAKPRPIPVATQEMLNPEGGLIVKAGRKYVTASGQVVGPMEISAINGKKFRAKHDFNEGFGPSYYTWYINGEYTGNNPDRKVARSIVKEYDAATTAVALLKAQWLSGVKLDYRSKGSIDQWIRYPNATYYHELGMNPSERFDYHCKTLEMRLRPQE